MSPLTRAFQRFDARPIVGYYLRGFQKSGTGGFAWADAVALFGSPILCGVCSYFLNARFVNVSPLLSASTLLVGVMLTVFVFLTNLRVKVAETDKFVYRRALQRMIGSAAVCSLYVAGLALVISAGLAITGGIHVPVLAGRELRRLGSAVLVMLLAHLAVNLLTVIRRVFAVYVGVFGADFSPDLESVPDSEPRNGSHRRRRTNSA